MKKITFLLFTFLTTLSWSQEKLTSSIEELNNNGVFENSTRTTYLYDINNNLTEENNFFWNTTTSTWERDSQIEYTYNVNNKAETFIIKSFVNEEIDEQGRELYSYDNGGNILEIVSQELENNVWINDFKIEFNYVNNRVDSELEFVWENNQWVLAEEGVLQIIYNENEDVVRSQNLTGSAGTPEENNLRTLYSYNTDNRLVSEDTQFWNGSVWVAENRVQRSYDANGNVINIKNEDFDDDGSVLSNSEELFTFDTTQLISDLIHPFEDKTGVDYLLEPLGIVNKIISETSSIEGVRTTYFYGNEPSLSTKTNKVLALKLYPNPTTDLVTVSGSNVSIKNIEVFNVLGKKIKAVTTNVISLKEFVAGVYVLKIRTIDGKIVVKRVLKN